MNEMQLRIIRTDARISDANYSHGAEITPEEARNAVWQRNLLLDYVDELTGALERARDLAVRSGTFQNWHGTDYELPTPGWEFQIYPVTIDRQVQQ